jgi:glycosyltransferase involved in cell wall biosynthesis
MAIKVCHVTSMHRYNDTRIFVKECGSLTKKYDVYLVASNVESHDENGIHIIGVSMPPHGIKKMLTTRPIIKAAEKVNADIYHFHDPELMKAGLKLRRNGKKVIFDYHENFAEFLLTKDWLPKLLRKPASKLFYIFEKRNLAQYNAIVSVTPFIVDRLKQYNDNTYQITNYPFSIDIPDHRQWEKSICFVGGIVPQWMHHNIIKCLPNTNATYKLAGTFAPESYREELEKEDGWEKVNYVGRVNYQNLFTFIQESSAGVTIRDYNDPNVGYKKGSLGVNKFFEYMMAGVPIISSGNDVWKDIIEKYYCGIIVEPDDCNSIADAINYIMNNPEEAKRMGDNGQKAAKDYYNWESQEAILFDMYDRVLKG